jgi:hypothetical protein
MNSERRLLMKIFDSYEAKIVTLISLAFCLLGVFFTVTIAGQKPVKFYQPEKLLNIEESHHTAIQDNITVGPYDDFYGKPYFELQAQNGYGPPVPRVY